jgi:hypothetical protein
MKRVIICICTIALAFLLNAQVYASAILADTTGLDNADTTDFYGVNFLAGTGFIHSVTFDISADPDAFFDFDGNGSYNDSTAPVIGAMGGLTIADFSSLAYSNFVDGDFSHPSVLTFYFAPESFGVGDYFRFSADTDFFVSDPAPGSVFAEGGAIFSALLEDGSSGTDIFRPYGSINSIAFVETSPSPVPIPATFWLFGSGLIGVVGIMRKRH